MSNPWDDRWDGKGVIFVNGVQVSPTDWRAGKRRDWVLRKALEALTGCPSLSFSQLPGGCAYICAICGEEEDYSPEGFPNTHLSSSHTKTDLAVMKALNTLYQRREEARRIWEERQARLRAAWKGLKWDSDEEGKDD